MVNESSENSKITTKQRIISAALKCFARVGIEQTKLIDIAQVAKIKHNLILYHFKDFEKLCLACVEQVVHNFFHLTQQISIEKQKSSEQHLEQFIAAHFRMAQIHRNAFSIWLHFYYKASIDSHYRQLFKSISLSSMEKLKSILLQYCTEKNMDRSQLQIEYIAQTVLSQIIGQLILSLSNEKSDFTVESKSCFLLAMELLKN